MASSSSLVNRICVVTGASAGIGREIARNLAKLGATVILAVRNISRGQEALEDITSSLGQKRGSKSNQLRVMKLDLSDVGSIKTFVEEFRDRFPEGLSVLVNNAAEVLEERTLSAQGIERMFGTNALGPYYLTTLLIDDLKKQAQPEQTARVVHVASNYAGHIDLDDLQFKSRRYDGNDAYQQSKAINRALSGHLARQLKTHNITSNACHPGVIKTTLLADLGFSHGNASVASGAVTPTWLASSPDVEGITGKYFDSKREVKCRYSADEKLGAGLAAKCDELLAQVFKQDAQKQAAAGDESSVA